MKTPRTTLICRFCKTKNDVTTFLQQNNKLNITSLLLQNTTAFVEKYENRIKCNKQQLLLNEKFWYVLNYLAALK